MGGHHRQLPTAADFTLKSDSLLHKLPVIGGIIGLAGIGGAVAMGGGFHDKQFAYSYLTAFMYWLSIALGALFFVMIQFATRAGWSVLVRRVAETVAATLPVFVLLFIPVILSMHTLYHHWLEPNGDPLILKKSGYLNEPFFLGRAAFYLLSWSALAWYFRSHSTRQDQTGDLEHTRLMQARSYPAIAIFALTITFAAIDWMKSLDPHWYSTMWGIYYFAGGMIGFFTFFGLVILAMTRKGADAFHGAVTTEHRHDIGKYTFGFVVFWAYIAFSQYFLIWYGSIPEETIWFQHRQHGGWENLGYALIFGHFVLPFFFLLSRHVKRNRVAYALGALWLLGIHYVDLYFNIMPVGSAHFAPHAVDALSMVGVGGIFVATFAALMTRSAIVPLRDPRLPESFRFENF